MKTETGTSQKPAPVQTDTNIRKSSDISNVTFGFFIALIIFIETILML